MSLNDAPTLVEKPTLANKMKRSLRQQAHHLKAVIMIGNKGLTEEVHKEIEVALEAHELIKIKINDHDKAAIAAMLPEICKTNRADHVQTIGHTVTIWRKNKK